MENMKEYEEIIMWKYLETSYHQRFSQNFLDEPKNKDYVSCFLVWGRDLRIFPILEAERGEGGMSITMILRVECSRLVFGEVDFRGLLL